MLLNVVLIVAFFVCLALLWNEGLWSNAITLVNTMFATMIATNYFEPAADFMESRMDSFTYLLDFLCIWLLFALTYSVLRSITDQLSVKKIKYKMPVEQAGRMLLAAWTGWVMVCFITMTLHLAPLARTSFRGAFMPEPMTKHFFGLAPDRVWLGFVQSRSRGGLSGSGEFDPQGDFVFKYADRRDKLQQNNAKDGTLRVKR